MITTPPTQNNKSMAPSSTTTAADDGGGTSSTTSMSSLIASRTTSRIRKRCRHSINNNSCTVMMMMFLLSAIFSLSSITVVDSALESTTVLSEEAPEEEALQQPPLQQEAAEEEPSAGSSSPPHNSSSSSSSTDLDVIHVAMFSDRGDAAATTLSSICSTTSDASLLTFHLVTGDPAPLLAKLKRVTGRGGPCEKSRINLISRTVAVDMIHEKRGRPPVWDWAVYRAGTCHDKESCRPIIEATKIHPAVWDWNPMHAHMLNHMRFYITEFMPDEVNERGQVILVDDDIIVLKDIRLMWNAGVESVHTPPEKRGEKIMAVTCNVWEWTNGGYTGRGGWEWIGVEGRRGTERRNMLESAVTGFKMTNITNHLEPECTNEDRDLILNRPDSFYRGCTEPGLLAELKNAAVEILGEDAVEKLMPNGPWNDTAWNYGLTLINLHAAKRHHAVETYERWVTAVLRKRLYPTTSIAFGLGIPYLVFMGRVTCYRDLPEKELGFILEGLSFVSPRALEWNFHGRSFYQMTMEDKIVYAVHYNGEKKPQIPEKAIIEYVHPFLMHTSADVKEAHDRKQKKDAERRMLEAALPPPVPFVVLTSPRSGSEFVMASIDRHPLICATGEVAKPGDEDRLGWPREAFMPPQLFTDDRIKYVAEESWGKLQCHVGALSKMLTKHLRYVKQRGSAALLEHCNAVYTKLWEDQVDETARKALKNDPSRLKVFNESSSTTDIKDLIMLLPREFLDTFTPIGINSILELEYTSCDMLRLSYEQMKDHAKQFGHLPDYNRTARHHYADVAFSLYLDFAYRGGNVGDGIIGNQRNLGGRMFGKLKHLDRALTNAQRETDLEKRSRLIDEALTSAATPPLPFHVGSPETAEAVGMCIACRCAPGSRAIGFKLMHMWYRAWHHKARMQNYYVDILPRLAKTHPDIKVVVLDRANPLRLMLSLLRAEYKLEQAMKMNNGSASSAYDWHAGSASGGGPQVMKDKKKFQLDVARIVKEVQWELHLRSIRDDMLKALGMPVLRLRYEACAKDIKTCVDAVAQFLGMPLMDLIGEESEDAAKSAEKESGGKEGASAKTKSILDEITNPDELLEAVKKRKWTQWLNA